jgi:hypothetical protein
MGLAGKLAGDIISSLNVNAAMHAAKAYLSSDPVEGLKALIDYELSRIKRASEGRFQCYSLMLHEIVVDTLSAYGLTHMLSEALEHVASRGVVPGVETRNLPSVYRSLSEHSRVFNKTIFAAPFNRVGFQMTPSRQLCEEIVKEAPKKVIAMSAFAGGYLKLEDALEYLAQFKEYLLGVVLGVSKPEHALSDFTFANRVLG